MCSGSAESGPLLLPGVSFNSVYTQIWRVLLHLAADPFPEVSDLAMKVLNSIAYKVGAVFVHEQCCVLWMVPCFPICRNPGKQTLTELPRLGYLTDCFQYSPLVSTNNTSPASTQNHQLSAGSGLWLLPSKLLMNDGKL